MKPRITFQKGRWVCAGERWIGAWPISVMVPCVGVATTPSAAYARWSGQDQNTLRPGAVVPVERYSEPTLWQRIRGIWC